MSEVPQAAERRRRRSADGGGSRDPDSENATTECAYCGAPVVTTEWHPVATRNTADGADIVAFCEQSCRRRWKRARARATGFGESDERR